MTQDEVTSIDDRFRGFLPVVVDLETGGFTPHTDAILELAGTLIQMSSDGYLSISGCWIDIARCNDRGNYAYS